MSNSRVIRPDEPVQVVAWRPGELAPEGEGRLERRSRPPPAESVAEPPSDAAGREVPAAPEPPPDPQQLERERQQALEAARAEGLARGLAEGRVQGHAEGLREAHAERARVNELAGRWQALADEMEARLSADVLSVALEVARQVVRHELVVHPEAVLTVVREAVRALPPLAQPPAVHVHPDDAALLRRLQAAGGDEAAERWVMVEDLSVSRGGCRLETAASVLDAGVEARWARVVASLGRDLPWAPGDGEGT